MKITIITHVVHKSHNNSWFAYEPYVREMNLWLKNISEIVILAPVSQKLITPIDAPYFQKNITLKEISKFDLLTIKSKIKAFFKIPLICFRIYKAMQWADHIHLRCPGNVGLLGCFVQISFPSKPKTVKYAGNWDPNSKQPWPYKLQKWILSNTFLTRNAKVLVYGEWANQSKNIIPFFTATYSEKDIQLIGNKDVSKELRFIYVGALHSGKKPILSAKVIHVLKDKGHQVKLDMYGDGDEKETLEHYIKNNNLVNEITLHGNKSKDVIKKAFMTSHFLLFISKSEGWPKVVAEAMFWGCVPITSKVSCVPWMLGNGKRGLLVNNDKDEIVNIIEKSIRDKEAYHKMSLKAQKWSQKYTLEVFDNEIQKLINETA